MITFIKKIISGQKKLYLGILAVLSLLSSFEFISVVMYSTSNIEVDFAIGYFLVVQNPGRVCYTVKIQAN